MIELLVGTVAFVVGFVVARRRATVPRRETMLALRQASSASGTYREQPGGEISCTLDELGARLDGAGLAHERQGNTLHVRRGKEAIRIVVHEPQRVTLASLDIYQSGCESLAYELALGLVPVFGPLAMVDGPWGRFVVDASKTTALLVEERAERIRKVAADIAADMRHKLEAYGGEP